MPSLQLTYQQKLDAYMWTIKNFATHREGPYLCKLLCTYCLGEVRRFAQPDISKLFPELYTQKPETALIPGVPWWDKADNMSRFNALQAAIKIVLDERDLL